MIRRLKEEKIIFYDVLRWFVLATIIGLCSGLVVSLFIKMLNWGTAYSESFSKYYWIAPVFFIINIVLIKYLAPDADGHGTEKVIEAVHKRAGRIKLAVIPVKLITTLLTLFSGGSVGKEGPSAQMGGGLASLLADLLKFSDEDRKKLVICGISAGFAAIFGTPISGAIFGIEVLFVGVILYDVLLPSFVAGITAFYITNLMGVTRPQYNIDFSAGITEFFILKIALAGVVFGLCAFLFIEIMNQTEKLAKRIKIHFLLKGVIGGTLIILIGTLFGTEALGLGSGTVAGIFSGVKIVWYLFILKIIITAVTLNFGGSGGVVTPVFFVGATVGALIGQLTGNDPALFAAIGLVAVLGGATNAPIAACIMGIELFGEAIAPYAALACVISFFITGNRSIYPTQILAMKKASQLTTVVGREIKLIDEEFEKK
ncbi:Chloride/fluoride channel protein [Polaribacter huanghezhanensis]|uniref:chloride channel protein n=1 Tax=Polaribacter huanghezhanensis TaxID=1354726 RepID=UPI00264704B0|nr:chloride channel protein [Polaribacter huanghezhanensis]WKD85051.1 Chloride/fluoride channel protein [Polaribacter huanghezhanensis]